MTGTGASAGASIGGDTFTARILKNVLKDVLAFPVKATRPPQPQKLCPLLSFSLSLFSRYVRGEVHALHWDISQEIEFFFFFLEKFRIRPKFFCC